MHCLYHHLQHLSRCTRSHPNLMCRIHQIHRTGVASGFAPGRRVPLLIAMFQMIDVVGRFAPQCSVLRIDKGWIVSGMALARILFVPIFMAMQRMSSEAWAQNGFLQIGAMAPPLNSSRIYFKMRLECLNPFDSLCYLCFFLPFVFSTVFSVVFH